MTQLWPLGVALLTFMAACSQPAAAYTCQGTGCCNYVCDDADSGDVKRCMQNTAGASIPKWWKDDLNGWESCQEKIAANYNTATPCSQAIRPDFACGLKDDHACGYGLACVAQTIAWAQCIPVCGDRYTGRRAVALEGFDVSKVTTGCTLDGQSGTVNPDSGYNVDVGDIVIRNGVAIPKCVADTALNMPRTPATPAPAPPTGSSGTPAVPILFGPPGSGGGAEQTPSGEAVPAVPITNNRASIEPVSAAALQQAPPAQGTATPTEPDAPITQPEVPPAVPPPSDPMTLQDMSKERRRRFRLANQAAGLNLGFMEVWGQERILRHLLRLSFSKPALRAPQCATVSVTVMSRSQASST